MKIKNNSVFISCKAPSFMRRLQVSRNLLLFALLMKCIIVACRSILQGFRKSLFKECSIVNK
jgi:hypothetical protein